MNLTFDYFLIPPNTNNKAETTFIYLTLWLIGFIEPAKHLTARIDASKTNFHLYVNVGAIYL